MTATRVKRRDLEARVWQLRCQGERQCSIAQTIGVNQSTVSRILRRVEARTLAEVHEQAHTMRAVQTAQLETLIEQLWRAWQRDQHPKLAEQLRCALADMRKLWGLNSPTEVELSVLRAAAGVPASSPDLSCLTDDEVDGLLRVIRKLEGQPGSGQDAATLGEVSDDGADEDGGAGEIPPLPAQTAAESEMIATQGEGPACVVVWPGPQRH